MRPPFAYYGGKSRLAPWIASILPPHRVYAEPFAGSAAVLFAKAPSTHEILNDADGQITNFFRVLRNQPDELELACRLTPYSRDEYSECASIDDAGDDIERARRWWCRSTQSFGAVAKINTGWSTSIQRGSNNARSAWNRIERFAACAVRLGTVVIENADAVDVVARYDSPDGVIYCDPPYLGSIRSSIAGGRRPSGDYAVEYHTDEQHRALAEALHAAQATVLISGYPSALYDEDLYAGWHRTERRANRRTTNGRSGADTHVLEVLWSNRPLFASEHLDLDVTGLGRFGNGSVHAPSVHAPPVPSPPCPQQDPPTAQHEPVGTVEA